MLAGIDIGSTGVKVALYTEHGTRIGYSYREYSIRYGSDGSAVISPSIWEKSIQECFEELKCQYNLKHIQALGISSANAIVLTDQEGMPVFPAIMQLDKRSASMVATIQEKWTQEQIFNMTGNRIAAGYQWGSVLKWLSAYESEKFKEVRRIFNPGSYLCYKLTNAYRMDRTRAMTTLLYNAGDKCWDDSLWNYFGMEQVEKPPILECNDIAGYVKKGTFLPEGIPICMGGVDTICAMPGLTAGKDADVLIMGSVGRFSLTVQKWDPCFLNTVDWTGQKKISMTPVNNTGTALKWIATVLGGEKDIRLSYEILNNWAAQVSPGSEGLLFSPFLNGASAPRWNDQIQGGFSGLKACHTKKHFVRAVMEGTALALEENQQILAQIGCDVKKPIYLGGGGAKSRVWTQIVSDVLQRELLIPESVETETIGAALLSGIAIGCLKADSCEEWNRIVKKVIPDSQYCGVYNDMKVRFSNL